MPRYVALLGSVNVGGNRLAMADLSEALAAAGFEDVGTVVASGNVLFEHGRAGEAALAGEIESIVKERFGFTSFVAVRCRDEIVQSIASNPFARDGEERFVHTLFLEQSLDRSAFEAFAKGYDGPERLAAGKDELYIDYCEGVGRSKLDPAMRKAKLIPGRATARNIRSLKRILEKMDV